MSIGQIDNRLIGIMFLAFFGHFEKNSRRIRKKIKQFFPKAQANVLKNSRICQLKTNFFTVLVKKIPKKLPQNNFLSLNSSKFSKNSRNSKINSRNFRKNSRFCQLELVYSAEKCPKKACLRTICLEASYKFSQNIAHQMN